uniref:Myb/SANT-like DNA-binding domain-containing protein n=1 Tax=Glossina brevipalpis TaxID=37001 RepID=A0A1A9WVF3_9MUSC
MRLNVTVKSPLFWNNGLPSLIRILKCEHNYSSMSGTSENIIAEDIECLDEITNSEEYGEQYTELYTSDVTFYPNALYCLLALYREHHDSIKKAPKETLNQTLLWENIAKEMQNSYFDFNAEQIRHKYKQLRQKYFNIKTTKDIENFEYFGQLHNIYHDERLVKLLNGQKSLEGYCKDYNDEISTSERSPVEEYRSNMKTNTFLKKSALEESETINVENTALKRSETSCNQTNCTYLLKDKEKQNINQLINIHSNKRPHTNLDSLEASPPRKIKLNANEKAQEAETINCNFNLDQYNAQQERRHQEHMNLLQQNLKIQERIIEVQNQLLQDILFNCCKTPYLVPKLTVNTPSCERNTIQENSEIILHHYTYTVGYIAARTSDSVYDSDKIPLRQLFNAFVFCNRLFIGVVDI